MNTTRLQMRYQRGDATADDIQAIADALLRELADPASQAAQEALAAGIDPQSVSDAAIEVRETAQGAEPFLTAVLIGIVVSAGSKVAESIWQDILWPRVKRRLGASAVGARQPGGAP